MTEDKSSIQVGDSARLNGDDESVAVASDIRTDSLLFLLPQSIVPIGLGIS